MALINLDEYDSNYSGSGAPINVAAPSAGSPGSDAILDQMMKRLDDEETRYAERTAAAEEADRAKRKKQLIPLGIASLLAAVLGGRKNGGNIGGSIFQGGMSGILSAREEEKKKREASSAAQAHGIQSRRTEFYKTLGDIAQERAKARETGMSSDRVRAQLLQKKAAGIPLNENEQAVLGSFETPGADRKTSEAKNWEYRKSLPPEQQAIFDRFVHPERSDSTPNDIKIFQTLYPGADPGSPEGRQSFIDLQGKLKNDPFLPLAIAVINNDMGAMRMTPDQKIQAAQALAGKLRSGGAGPAAGSGGSGVIKYDATGNRVQ